MNDNKDDDSALRSINIDVLISKSFAVVFSNLSMTIGVVIVAGLMALITEFSAALLGAILLSDASAVDNDTIDALSGVAHIVMIPVYVCVMVGIQKVYLELLRNKETSIQYLLTSFRRILSLTWATILLRLGQVVVVGVLFVFGAFLFNIFFLLGIFVGLPLMVLAGYFLYLTVGAGFYDLVIIEQGANGWSGLNISYERARPHLFKITMAFFVMGLIMMIIALAFMALLFVVVSIVWGMDISQFFHMIKQDSNIGLVIVTTLLQSVMYAVSCAMQSAIYKELFD